MNTVQFGGAKFYYEGLWRKTRKIDIMDADNNKLPYPTPSSEPWHQRELFINQLHEIQTHLERLNQFTHMPPQHCLLCSNKSIATKYYEIDKKRWDDGLLHYIKKHQIKPSEKFIDLIFSYPLGAPPKREFANLTRLTGKHIIKANKIYLKLTRNQIHIMDALLIHGSTKVYKDKKKYKFSEHAGLLDFADEGLERIIISGKTTRIDKIDNEIFFPGNIMDALDYEYIFHTHPPTNGVGGRALDGVLYEFPSVNDLLHFIQHYNEGDTQGSIVIAAEGMYIIRKHKFDDTPLKIKESLFIKKVNAVFQKVQSEAIDKYGTDFLVNEFYEKIAQNKTYIQAVNKELITFGLFIEYYPRINDNGEWIIDTIHIPIYVQEYE